MVHRDRDAFGAAQVSETLMGNEQFVADPPRGPEVPLARMSRRVFDDLDDLSLARAAVEPIMVAVRAKSPAAKAAIYETLSPGRRALFAFWVVFGHARDDGWTRFFSEVPYLYELPEFFLGVRQAFDYIGDGAMATLVGDVEGIHAAQDQPRKDRLLDPEEPSHSAIIEALAPLDCRYRSLVASSLARIAACVRNRPSEFVAFHEFATP